MQRRLCATAEALRETTGAELYPAEAMIQERFLTAVRADAGSPHTLGTARALSADELIAQAAEASVDGAGPQHGAQPRRDLLVSYQRLLRWLLAKRARSLRASERSRLSLRISNARSSRWSFR